MLEFVSENLSFKSLLVEKFRPKQMGEVLLVKRLREQLEQYQDTNILLHSPPGMGKTSVAKILVAGHEDDLLLINGSKENGIDVIRTEVSNFCMTMSVYGGKKFILIEECDGLTEQAWNALQCRDGRVVANTCALLPPATTFRRYQPQYLVASPASTLNLQTMQRERNCVLCMKVGCYGFSTSLACRRVMIRLGKSLIVSSPICVASTTT